MITGRQGPFIPRRRGQHRRQKASVHNMCQTNPSVAEQFRISPLSKRFCSRHREFLVRKKRDGARCTTQAGTESSANTVGHLANFFHRIRSSPSESERDWPADTRETSWRVRSTAWKRVQNISHLSDKVPARGSARKEGHNEGVAPGSTSSAVYHCSGDHWYCAPEIFSVWRPIFTSDPAPWAQVSSAGSASSDSSQDPSTVRQRHGAQNCSVWRGSNPQRRRPSTCSPSPEPCSQAQPHSCPCVSVPSNCAQNTTGM